MSIFGYTTIGEGFPDGYFGSSADQMSATVFTASEDGVVKTITAYVTHDGGGQVKGVILDSSKSILTNGITLVEDAPTDGWVTLTFETPPEITASQDYYLGILTDSNTGRLYSDSSGSVLSFIDANNSFSSPFDPNIGDDGSDDDTIQQRGSIYATYVTITTDTYYFDGEEIADPDSNWSNDANAFDGDTNTTVSAISAGSSSSNYLQGSGTSAPTSGEVITQVRARLGADSGGVFYGSWVVLDAPTSGWSWNEVNNLAVRLWFDGSTDTVAAIYESGDLGGTNLGSPSISDGGSGLSVVEVEVTHGEEDDVPTVTTDAVDNIEPTSADFNGEITDIGGDTPIERGFVFDTVSRSNPGNILPDASEYTGWRINSGSYSTGTFTINATGLSDGVTYYVRAFAGNESEGYSYGDEVQFTTIEYDPISFDAITTIGEGYPNTTDTISHTVSSGYGALLVVGITHTDDLNGVTYDGESMTLLETDNVASNLHHSVYYLFDPTQGSAQNVVVDTVGTQNLSMTAVSYLGVDNIPYSTTFSTVSQYWAQGMNTESNGTWHVASIGSDYGVDSQDGTVEKRGADVNLWNHAHFDTGTGYEADEYPIMSFAQGSSGGAGFCMVSYTLEPLSGEIPSANVESSSVTEVGSSFATGNASIIEKGGTSVTKRGFVYGTTSQSDPGNTDPESTSYDNVTSSGDVYSPVYAIGGEIDLAAGTTSDTVDVNVPVGKSFAIVSLSTNQYRPSRSLATARLENAVNGRWTQLRIQRSFATSSDGTYAWQVLWSDDFTVQSGLEDTSNDSQVDITIDEIDQSKAFVVLSSQTNNTGAISAYARGKFTSDTNLQLNKGSSDTSSVVQWYVVEWEGASVQSGELVFDGVPEIEDTLSTAVDEDKAFVQFSYEMQAFSTNSGVVATKVSIDDTTTVLGDKDLYWSGGIHGIVDYFVVEHPMISVQKSTLNTTNDTADFNINTVDMFRSFMPTSLVGNAALNTNANSTNHHHYNSHHIVNANLARVTRGVSNNTLRPHAQVVEDTTTIYNLGSFDATLTSLDPETTYYVRPFIYADGEYIYGDEESFQTTEEVEGGGSSAAPLLALM